MQFSASLTWMGSSKRGDESLLLFFSVFAIQTERRNSVSRLLRLQSSEQTKEKEREKGEGGGALITAGIEEKRGPVHIK